MLERAAEFMITNKTTPTFTWIHLNGPHPPCHGKTPDDRFLVDEGLASRLEAFRMEGGRRFAGSPWQAIQLGLDRRRKTGEDPAPLIELAEALYDGQLRRTDTWLENFFARLEREGVLEHTLVAVFSDHGIQLRPEALNARGPREEGVRIPLIVAGPGVPPGPRKIDVRISTVDLAPTLLDLLGFEAPVDIEGRSLAPLIRGEPPPEPGDGEIFSILTGTLACWFGEYKYLVSDRELVALTEGRVKLEGAPMMSEALYRLGPGGKGEAKDLKSIEPTRLAEARRRMVDWWRGLDRASAKGPANQALVGFFRKAGYMR